MPLVSEDYLEHAAEIERKYDELSTRVKTVVDDLRQIASTMHTYDLDSNIDSVLDAAKSLERVI